MKNQEFQKILKQVPLDYYQKGTKNNPLQRYWHSIKVNFAIKLLKTVRFKNCLEVGSASGYLLSQIAKKYPRAKFYGIDAYDEAIKYAKKKYPKISFKTAYAEKLPYKNNQFDLVLCYETIEHVQNPKKTMLEMKRVLKQDGTLILSMDSGNLLFRIIWFFWEKTHGKVWEGAHLNPFTAEDLRKLILDTKFKIQKKYLTHYGLEVVYVLKK